MSIMSSDASSSMGSTIRASPDLDKIHEAGIPTVEQRDVEKAPAPTIPFDDWNGDDDPKNPYNWALWRKALHVLGPGLISFSASFGSSIYTPSVPQIMQEFGVSQTVALLPLSIYVLALGAGPLLAAPISETFGRYVIYLVSPPLGIIFTLGAGFSKNITTLIILRFFAGLFFSPALAVGAGTNADMFPPIKRAIPTAFYVLTPFLGPSFGPVIGSFVTVRKGWEWTQFTLVFFAIFAWLIILPGEETHKGTLLERRNKKLGLPPPPSPFPNKAAKIRFLVTVISTRPLHMLFTEPIVLFTSLYIAFNFGVLFTFFAAFPHVYALIFGFSTEQAGLVFLGIGIGCALAVPTVIIFDHFLYKEQYRLSHAEGREGVVAPEHRLYPAMIGSLGLPTSLFWFAWTARSDISWVSSVVATIPFAWGNLTIFIATSAYMLDTYGALNGASSLAANGLLRYIFGCAFPLFALQMYKALGVAWATSLLGFVTVALLPIPWVLFKYGPKIRSLSQYETIKT